MKFFTKSLITKSLLLSLSLTMLPSFLNINLFAMDNEHPAEFEQRSAAQNPCQEAIYLAREIQLLEDILSGKASIPDETRLVAKLYKQLEKLLDEFDNPTEDSKNLLSLLTEYENRYPEKAISAYQLAEEISIKLYLQGHIKESKIFLN